MLWGKGIDEVLSRGLGVASQEHADLGSQSRIFERLTRIYAKQDKQIYQNRGSNGSRPLEEDTDGQEVNHDPV